ncbi:MAG TPA: PqqD family protein [Pyrinomonadaceae bacterium]|jgi:DNA-binding transcriptional ArsR family regulator
MDYSDKSFSKRPELTTRAIAGETLIVPVTGHVGDLDSIYTLNDVGSRIWQLINDQTKVRQIVEAIREEYDVTTEEAERDVTELLNSLTEAGLIREAENVG